MQSSRRSPGIVDALDPPVARRRVAPPRFSPGGSAQGLHCRGSGCDVRLRGLRRSASRAPTVPEARLRPSSLETVGRSRDSAVPLVRARRAGCRPPGRHGKGAEPPRSGAHRAPEAALVPSRLLSMPPQRPIERRPTKPRPSARPASLPRPRKERRCAHRTCSWRRYATENSIFGRYATENSIFA